MVPTALNMTRVPDKVMDAVGPYIEASQIAGRMLVQLAPDAISSLQVKTYGELAKVDAAILGTAALQGIISETTDERVNFVNAEHLAEERGINLIMASEEKCADYTSMLRLRGHAGDRDVEVVVTASTTGEIRIVGINGYKFDTAPAENILLIGYVDGPGRLGKICPVLGDANINISTMQVSNRGEQQDVALVVFNLDEPCSESVRDKLAVALDEYSLRGIWYIHL